MIVIIGASGSVGMPTIRHLVKRGQKLRALTSSNLSSQRLLGLGVAETIVGDFRKTDDVRRALAGASTVFHIPPRFTEDEYAIGRRVVDAARRERVQHFVMSSAFQPQMRKMDHHWNKLLVEEAVIESGIAYTILQPAMFMQNLRADWPGIRERGIYSRPYSPDRKLALLDTEDLGEAAAIVLSEPRYRGATFELCSGESLTHAEMAQVISEEWGRPVRADKRALDDWSSWAETRGWRPWSIGAYLKMCRHYDQYGYPGGNPLALTAILGRPPGTYRNFVRRFLGEQDATR